MKQYINLFSIHFQSKRTITRYKKIRRQALFSIFIFVILGVIVQGINLNYQEKIKNADKEQNLLISSIINAQNKGAPLNELVIRKSYLSKYLTEDVQFTTYFRLLQSILTTGSQGATIASFTLDNQQSTSFSIAFSSYEDFLDFLSGVNDTFFLNNFTALTLEPISYNQVVDEKKVSS